MVGGGIGGLATALALSQRGWRVEVLERSARFEEVGAGISLWPNALRALDALGQGDAVRRQALVQEEAGIRNAAGDWLLRTDTGTLERRFGPIVVLHRHALLRTLVAALPGGALLPGVEVAGVEVRQGRPQVITDDGDVRGPDLVVGADGIRSTVRRSRWREARPPRYAGYTAWRLIVPAPATPPPVGEIWGRGERVGVAPLPDGQLYLFATANRPAGARSRGGEAAELRRRFATWRPPVPQLLGSPSVGPVLCHDIEELPALRSFVSGPVVLVGDAAHAMTPNLGQGACQALEDAVTLAAVLETHADVEMGLAAYDALRVRRTRRVADRSRLLGQVGQWQSAPAVAFRDAILRATPASSQLRALTGVLGWVPPG